MEHFRNWTSPWILAAAGMVVITIPNGYGFDDNLYRYLMKWGHINRFGFKQIVSLVEETAAIRLVRWHELYSSYVYLKASAFGTATFVRGFAGLHVCPRGFLCSAVHAERACPICCQIGWSGSRPLRLGTLFSAAEPLTDSRIGKRMHALWCGHRAGSLAERRLGRLLYRCPSCNELNPYFADWVGKQSRWR
jgi:hypothetical protein